VGLRARGQGPAAETLFRDWDDLTTFYDYPAEHWVHLRTSNPVESVFAGVRLRTTCRSGCAGATRPSTSSRSRSASSSAGGHSTAA
jgi:hypothetical protein